MPKKWKVIAEPKGKNPGIVKRTAVAAGLENGENVGGVVIFVTDGNTKQEVSRVAYIRREGVCKNPSVAYADQLEVELGKARETCEKLNELLAEPDEVAA